MLRLEERESTLYKKVKIFQAKKANLPKKAQLFGLPNEIEKGTYYNSMYGTVYDDIRKR